MTIAPVECSLLTLLFSDAHESDKSRALHAIPGPVPSIIRCPHAPVSPCQISSHAPVPYIIMCPRVPMPSFILCSRALHHPVPPCPNAKFHPVLPCPPSSCVPVPLCPRAKFYPVIPCPPTSRAPVSLCQVSACMITSHYLSDKDLKTLFSKSVDSRYFQESARTKKRRDFEAILKDHEDFPADQRY